jgi:SAM-dependent methyltransferase
VNSATFRGIYRDNEWGYGSGVGSLPLNNVRYMEFVQGFMRRNAVSSVVDLGCGDWQFSQFIDWTGVDYTGLDVVPEVVERNRARFGREGVRFEVAPSLAHVGSGDLLLCKDVFQHLPNRTVVEYLDALKPRFRFLLITNDEGPGCPNLPDGSSGSDIEAGGWRPIRLDLPPFNEMAPVVLWWSVTWGGWRPTEKATALIVTRGTNAR